jgi:serine protease Do
MVGATELQASARQVVERVGPAVVRIGRDGGRGCGVVVGEGLVLTNAHNLRDRTTQVTFAGGRAEQAVVAGADVDGDLAVLQVDTGGVAPVDWCDQPPALGDLAFAVAATSTGGRRVTFGMVSADERAFRGPRGRRISGAVEHTVPLARGSSGSPLVDDTGRLLGINTNRVGESFYLAVPAGDELRQRVAALARGEQPDRAQLGVGLAPSHVARRLRRAVGLPERDGVLVRLVEDGSAAAHAGLAVGDLLVSADGRVITDVDDLFEVLAAVEPGASLRLRVVRGVDELEVAVSFSGDSTTEGTA